MAGAVVLADALAANTAEPEKALVAHEARLRPWMESAQRMARRNVRLFTRANRLKLLAREAVLRLAARPFLAPVVKRLQTGSVKNLGQPACLFRADRPG